MNWNRVLLALFPLALFLSRTAAAGKKADGTPEEKSLRFFEEKIRPVLIKHCYACHSAKAGKSEGKLRVDSRKAIRAGGGCGPAVVPGKPAKSWLLTFHQWGAKAPISEVMSREFLVAEDTEPLDQTFRQMRESDIPILPVTRGGELVGIITLENIAEWIMIQSSLRIERKR